MNIQNRTLFAGRYKVWVDRDNLEGQGPYTIARNFNKLMESKNEPARLDVSPDEWATLLLTTEDDFHNRNERMKAATQPKKQSRRQVIIDLLENAKLIPMRMKKDPSSGKLLPGNINFNDVPELTADEITRVADLKTVWVK